MRVGHAAPPRKGHPAREGPAATGEEGSVTIVLVGVIGALIVLVAGLTLVGRAMIASERARTASDEAALAGAWVLSSGDTGETPCASAARVASANGAHLSACEVIADSVQVSVQTRGPLAHRPEAVARAGPPEAASPGAAPKRGEGR